MLNQIVEKLFKLQAHGTTFRTEVVAGLTTFAAMSYVLVVNPNILAASGMPIEGLITVTALAACLGTLLMAMMTQLPDCTGTGYGPQRLFRLYYLSYARNTLGSCAGYRILEWHSVCSAICNRCKRTYC